MSFDFDREIPREDTHAVKYDGRTTSFGTQAVLPLWVADMDFAVPEAVERALSARAGHPVYGYTLQPESLFDALIGWLYKRHHWQVQRDTILLLPGVVPSLHAAVMALTQPGDAVIVQPPVYPPFFSSVTMTGRRLVLNPLSLEQGRYTMDFEHLERCAAEGARLLLLCSPHNPVGRVWRLEELQRLMEIAQRYGMVIVSDEIHADLIYPEYTHIPLANLAGSDELVISAVAPSKTFNIPGLGLSALIAPNPQHRACLQKVLQAAAIHAANPFSIAAFEAAYRDGEAWLDALLVYLRDTRDDVSDYLARELPIISLIAPEGTYLLWLDCRNLEMTDAELKDFFVKQARVGMNPGSSYGEGGAGFMRMNIGAPRRVVSTAWQQIHQALDKRQYGGNVA